MIHTDITSPPRSRPAGANDGVTAEPQAAPFLLERTEPGRLAVEDKVSAGIAGDGGLIGQYPWRSVPLHVSNDLSPPYFDIFRAQEVNLTTVLRTGGDWRWRFCTASGAVLAAGAGYRTENACVAAVDALRQAAGSAEIRRRPQGPSLPRDA